MCDYKCEQCGDKFSGRKKKYCSQKCSNEARRIRNRSRWREANPNWNKGISKTCVHCGKEFYVSARYKHAEYCSDDCRYTANSRAKGRKPIDIFIKERKEQSKANHEIKEKKRLIRKILISNEAKKKEKATTQEKKIKELTRQCVECGDTFYNPSPNVLTCSSECSRKRSRRISRMIYKGRINENNLVDKNISLTKLYKRDGGTCYLCGEWCDWNDKVITDEGHTIVGESYPSIEHVVPLSKGGKHSWNNIKLACMKCNTLKRDKVINIKDERVIV